MNVPQLTKEQAIAFYDSGKWKKMTPAERGKFQLYQAKLCMPFNKFHEGIEALLGREVWTHEFADQQRLIDEYEGKRPKGTVADSFRMLQEIARDMPIVVVAHEQKEP